MRKNAFRPRARLAGPNDFKALLASKPAARSRRFTVHAVRNQRSFARLGIIVGKRTVQHAVARNSLKRLIRETFRTRQRELAGYDLLVRVREAVRRADANASHVELADLLTLLIK